MGEKSYRDLAVKQNIEFYGHKVPDFIKDQGARYVYRNYPNVRANYEFDNETRLAKNMPSKSKKQLEKKLRKVTNARVPKRVFHRQMGKKGGAMTAAKLHVSGARGNATSVRESGKVNFMVGHRLKSAHSNGCVWEGGDYVQNVSGSNGAKPGYIYVNFQVSPSTVFANGARLNFEGCLWEKYRFRKFTIHYRTGTTTSIACGFTHYFDNDPISGYNQSNTASIGNPSNIAASIGHAGRQEFACWENSNVSAPVIGNTWYYTDPMYNDPRLAYQWQYNLVQTVSCNTATDLGILYATYEVEFAGMQLGFPRVYSQWSYGSAAPTVYSTTNPLGIGAPSVTPGSSGLEVVLGSNGTGSSLTCPPGRYQIILMTNAGTSIVAPTFSGINAATIDNNGYINSGSTTTSSVFGSYVTFPSTPVFGSTAPYLQVVGGAAVGTVTWKLWVTPVPPTTNYTYTGPRSLRFEYQSKMDAERDAVNKLNWKSDSDEKSDESGELCLDTNFEYTEMVGLDSVGASSTAARKYDAIPPVFRLNQGDVARSNTSSRVGSVLIK